MLTDSATHRALHDAPSATTAPMRFECLVDELLRHQLRVRCVQRSERRVDLVAFGRSVTLLLAEQEDCLLARCHLQAMPCRSAERGRTCQALLDANLVLEGADRLGISVFEDTAIYQRALPLAQLEGDDLARQLRAIVDRAAALAQALPRA
jgi:hypothetical protein